MNSRATNITRYIHVCTTAITMQMVVNFIIDLENNVRTRNFRADCIFRTELSVRADRDQIFQDQNSSDRWWNTTQARLGIHACNRLEGPELWSQATSPGPQSIVYRSSINEVGLACETTYNYSAGLKAKYRPGKKVYLQSTTIINMYFKTVRSLTY